MPAQNTATSYGGVARSLHWLTALLILSAIGLGLYAENLPYDTSETLAAKAQVFSLHKTIGVAAFFVALARILWALTQPRPVPLHPERRLETFAADTVHWALYGSMLMVPLAGWVHHAAVDGFAPILWPFGQNLPMVPKSESTAALAGAMHWLFSKVLIASILLHVAGAVKHAVIDRDATLARMTRGTEAGQPGASHALAPALTALAIYALAAGAAVTLLAPASDITATAAAPAEAGAPVAAGGWQVLSGSLGFTVKQMGADVQGNLPDWKAEITFDETPVDGRHGKVRVEINTATLTLGSVTDQAKGAEFFDTATHPTALFEADILPAASGYEAQGTLTLRGKAEAVTLPFTLDLQGDTARMTGSTTLDRRAFGMGASYGDESSVGFAVQVSVDLTAQRR
ncbi:cytochrome b/b6 domain-containing protein [Gemmobacter denitrificans]|uniref:Cytochrome b/b6 domain-containing protein n=1 Tax=Gemmobacter denitrificans TaxID=3123040 RepID=A0ABU8BPV9_9RHOB